MDTRFPALAPQSRSVTLALPLKALPLGEWTVFSALILLLLWA
ncbi:hypothetical protein [Rhodobacter sp. Har01]|nr:hypothetical protein [Rhodobacter sp. Har01]